MVRFQGPSRPLGPQQLVQPLSTLISPGSDIDSEPQFISLDFVGIVRM